MRQELTSWLKAECQGVGLDLIDAVVSVSGVVDDAFDLSIPGKTMSASDMLEIDLKHTIDAITSVPVKYLTTEERQVIFNLTNEIRDSISKLRYPTDSIKEPADIIQKKALRLQLFIQKYLMEKVVECQVGKPTPEHLTPEQEKTATLILGGHWEWASVTIDPEGIATIISKTGKSIQVDKEGAFVGGEPPVDSYYWTARFKETGEISESATPFDTLEKALEEGKSFALEPTTKRPGEVIIEIWTKPYRYSERLEIEPTISTTLTIER